MFKIVTILVTAFVAAAIAAFAFLPANAADAIEARAQGCGLCHGPNGEPTDPKVIPVIWGQRADYLFKELHDYRSGDRSNAVMKLIAQNIALEDLRKMAVYFAAKNWPAKAVPASAAPPPETIAAKLEQCRLCHGRNFEGGAPAPRLAGLSAEYLLASMQSFADGERTNNLDMPGFMKALTDAERQAMAKYLSAL